VAACDYEDELPKSGGYNNPEVPWPSDGATTVPSVHGPRHPVPDHD
jgi:hypothetical protein